MSNILFSNINVQEMPETQPSTGTSSSVPEDEDPIIEDIHKADSSISATKRKRNFERQNLARKKPKKTAEKPAIIDEDSLLVTRLKVAKQDLKTEKERSEPSKRR